MHGWVQFHRKMIDNPVFHDPFMYKLWSLCLFKASHQEHEILVGRQTVLLQRGQFVTGRESLANDYNNRMKKQLHVKPITLWRWLETLEKMQMLNINSNNKYSLITVVNWDIYNTNPNDNAQQNEQQMISKCTTNDQQMITNNNVNKGDKGKKEKTLVSSQSKSEYTIEFEEFWSKYPRRKEKAGAYKAWQARIKQGVTTADMIRATESYTKECKTKQTDEKYIKLASTFIGPNKPYEDYLTQNVQSVEPPKPKEIDEEEQAERAQRRKALEKLWGIS